MTKNKKTKRTQIKDLSVSDMQMTAKGMEKVQGGGSQTDLGGGVTGAQASLLAQPVPVAGAQATTGWRPRPSDPRSFGYDNRIDLRERSLRATAGRQPITKKEKRSCL